MKSDIWRFLVILFGCVWLSQPLSAAAAPATFASATVKLHDLELLDQDGKSRRFQSDVIGDRLVAITFTYTTCTTICPILDSIFEIGRASCRERV